LADTLEHMMQIFAKKWVPSPSLANFTLTFENRTVMRQPNVLRSFRSLSTFAGNMGHADRYDLVHPEAVPLNIFRSSKRCPFTCQTLLCIRYFHRFLHPILRIPPRPQFLLLNRQSTTHLLSTRSSSRLQNEKKKRS
jgi:hypothetical protein